MQEKYQTTKKKKEYRKKKSEVYVNPESESSGAIICGADPGSAGPSVRGPGRREDGGVRWPDLCGYHYVEVVVGGRGVLCPSPHPLLSPPVPANLLPHPHPHLRLHFSPRAKVRQPGGAAGGSEANAQRSPGRRPSLAMQLDPLTYDLEVLLPQVVF